MVTEGDSPAAKVRLYEIKTIEGSASITIRKQKQIFLFEFKLDIYFDAVNLKSPENEEEKAMGRVVVDEFNQDDDEIEVDVVCEKPTEFVAQVKKVLKTQIKAQILRVVSELKGELKRIDANEDKLRRDKLEREQAAKEY